MSYPSLAGRVVLITGVSRDGGIGAGIARRLAAEGAHLALHSWVPHDLDQPWGGDQNFPERLARELRDGGTTVTQISADFIDPYSPHQVMAHAISHYGHVDAVVANHARSSTHTLEQITATELDHSFAVNTRASVLLVREWAAQHDDTRPGGRAILFTSGQYHGAMPTELAYVASKAALQGITSSLAVHLAPRGITVNCINPGPVDTGYPDQETRTAVCDAHPSRRWGHPQDTANLVTWLLSDEASWINGQTLASDGAWSVR